MVDFSKVLVLVECRVDVLDFCLSFPSGLKLSALFSGAQLSI